jgi:hypothetical protein
MPNLKHLFVFSMILFVGCNSTCTSGNTKASKESWHSYFPSDHARSAKVMELSASPELESVGRKIQKAMTENPEWFMSFMSKTPKGQPMPYDEKLGVTKEEYKLLLENKLQLKQVATIDINFKQIDEERIKIVAPSESPLNGLVISADQVVTPHAILTRDGVINNTDENSATGPWSGLRWHFFDDDNHEAQGKALDETKLKSIQFSAGKLKRSDEWIIYYDVKDIDVPAGRHEQFSYIIYYH